MQESGVPMQEVIAALSKEDWANNVDRRRNNKWGWCFWTDTKKQIHCEAVEEDFEQLHMRGYIYIDANGQIWPTARAWLALGR